MIADRLIRRLEKEATRRIPQHANRISSIGFPCERMLCYSILRWEDRSLPAPELMSIFNEGNIQERAIKFDIERVGIEIEETQSEVSFPEYRLYGHIDGVFYYRGKRIPVEFKSMSEHIFDKMNTPEDFMNAKFAHHRCYIPQLQLYMRGKGLKSGLLVLKNKSTGWVKEIPVKADKALCAAMFAKCDRINAHVDLAREMLREVYQVREIADFAKKKDRDDYDEIRAEACKKVELFLPFRIKETDVCKGCNFEHICLPDEVRQERARVLIHDVLAAKLEERENVKEFRDRYEELDKEVKEIAKQSNLDSFLCGGFEVTITRGKQTRVNIEKI